MLVEAKISAEDAKSLVEQLLAAEAKVDPAVVAKFSAFEGTVVIDGAAGHSAHQHGKAQTSEDIRNSGSDRTISQGTHHLLIALLRSTYWIPIFSDASFGRQSRDRQLPCLCFLEMW